jgi:hypothetical protein
MLGSFLVGYLNRALPALLRSRAITCDLLLLATANLDGHRYRRRPWLAATGRSPVARQTSGVRLDLSYSCSGRGWLEALTGQVIGGLGHHGTSLRWRSLAEGRRLQTGRQQSDDLLPSMTIAFMALAEAYAAINR